MPTQKIVTLYQFDELSDRAKEKAREWFRVASAQDEFWDCIFEDAATIAELFGLTIKTSTQKYHVMGRDGKPGRDGFEEKTHIFFTGFASQGDGACFEGSYQYKADALEAVKKHAPVDEKLHSIVEELQAAQARAGNRIAFNITHTGRSCHEHSMSFELVEEYYDANGDATPEDQLPTAEQVKDVEEALIRFAKWIYRQLEAEYEYRNSDENVDEIIRINKYTFLASGERED